MIQTPISSPEPFALPDGYLLDYISGEPIKDSSKEKVRQRLARVLFHEYGISVQDMARDFPVRVDGRKKKIDLVIFGPDLPHIEENIHRIVVCQKEPTNGSRSTFTIRDHEQAQNDVAQLQDLMTVLEQCHWGLWTNGIEFFFFEKEINRFSVDFKPIGDWPFGDETMGTQQMYSSAHLRRADPEMLKVAFHRCHNFIHGNEGMPKDAAFWQFLYLIFAKMYDERQKSWELRKFWAGSTEQFEEAGRKAIRNRILPLFEDVKKAYPTIFSGKEEITLSDRALAFMVSELARYDLTRTDMDAKGAAYQEIVGTNLRGDRGQFFTPRGAIKLMVEMLNPAPGNRILDPACGTGGFLTAVVDHLFHRLNDETDHAIVNGDRDPVVRERLSTVVGESLRGADFDPFLVRAAQMNILMAANTEIPLFHMNSLEFPEGSLAGVAPANNQIPLGSIDVVLTNPPFGTDIPITDPSILFQYDLARIWERTSDGSFRNTGRLQTSVAPEILFIERCLQWLRPGGKMGIVLPNGILGNAGDEYIRWWILSQAWVLASVELPVEVFIVEANVNILTSLLFLKKKTVQEQEREYLAGRLDYPVFLAVAEKAGVDRRGNILYKRGPDGIELVQKVREEESMTIGGKRVVRTLTRVDRIVDDDLPRIAEEYHQFRSEHPEPGV